MQRELVLSLFPGIGLLDRAFEECGFCVVRGPDLLWGGDIRRFHPPEGHFWGAIGGPPCQDFSRRRRDPPSGYGLDMLREFLRVVAESQPEWFLLENVDRVPDVTAPGYVTQRLDVDNGWFEGATSRRLRHVQFGSKSGRLLNVPHRSVPADLPGAALANDSRSFADLCHLQGLPEDFDLPGFLMSEKKRAVGNGVPLPMGRALAAAVIEAYRESVTVQADLFGNLVRPDTCACGCGRPVPTGQMYAIDEHGNTDACRKRAQRSRAKGEAVTWPLSDASREDNAIVYDKGCRARKRREQQHD